MPARLALVCGTSWAGGVVAATVVGLSWDELVAAGQHGGKDPVAEPGTSGSTAGSAGRFPGRASGSISNISAARRASRWPSSTPKLHAAPHGTQARWHPQPSGGPVGGDPLGSRWPEPGMLRRPRPQHGLFGSDCDRSVRAPLRGLPRRRAPCQRQCGPLLAAPRSRSAGDHQHRLRLSYRGG